MNIYSPSLPLPVNFELSILQVYTTKDQDLIQKFIQTFKPKINYEEYIKNGVIVWSYHTHNPQHPLGYYLQGVHPPPNKSYLIGIALECNIDEYKIEEAYENKKVVVLFRSHYKNIGMKFYNNLNIAKIDLLNFSSSEYIIYETEKDIWSPN